ncbi:MAG: isoprenylcysteine carboxylmethyltransferase family protein [Candidatus Omnitrophica bacterium]|nr:isoprenylcysteine carboxylmethyltransferase family protein [Candidatus Omnitrophota bacterium]
MSNLLARIKRLFRLRFAVFYPLAVYLAFFTVPSIRSTACGAVFMVAGMFMRLWSNGYAIKMDKLTTSGPYAYVRNPLYVGTGLILLGVVVMLKLFWVGLITFAVLAAVYTRTIRSEQKMLTDKFGAAFLDYCAKVPAMWSAFTPYEAGDKWPFSWQRVWDSREHKVVLWLTIVVIGFQLKREFMIEGERSHVRIIVMVAIACCLALADVLGEVYRHRQKKGA